MIFNTLGTPSEEVIAKIDKPDARKYVRCFQERPEQPLNDLRRFRSLSPAALELLQGMLRLDHEERITIVEVPMDYSI